MRPRIERQLNLNPQARTADVVNALAGWVANVGAYFNDVIDYMPVPVRKSVSAAHTILLRETIIGCDTTSAGFTVTLPVMAKAGHTILIQDEGGAAGSNNITIAAGSGDTLYGTSSIASNHGRVVVYSDGAKSWFSA